MTTRLWCALKHASSYDPRDARGMARLDLRDRLSFRLRLLIAALVLAGICAGMSIAPDVVLLAFFGSLVAISVGYIALYGTLSGAGWASQIAVDIARERESGAYDVLATSPQGAPGASWRLCAAALNRHGAFGSEDAERVWLLRTFFCVVVIYAVVVSPTMRLDPDGLFRVESLLIGIVNLSALLVALRVDDVQSVVTSGLVGMLVPTYTRQPNEARAWSVVGFLAVQVSAYLLVFALGFVVLPALLDPSSVTLSLALPVLRVVLFALIREAVNRALLAVLAARFETIPDDLYRAAGLR